MYAEHIINKKIQRGKEMLIINICLLSGFLIIDFGLVFWLMDVLTDY